jgi:AraC-like DNA-binding protein
MKPVFEPIPDRESESFWCETIQGPGFGCTWHFHPEYELTLTLRSQGHRVVGDHYATLEPGDLVLVGPNLPHIWQNAGRTGVHARVIQFRNDFLGQEFLGRAELVSVRRLLARSWSGLQVTGRTRQRVADRMQELGNKTRYDRLLDLLWILGEISRSRELHPLASAGFHGETDQGDEERMTRIWKFISQRLGEPVYLRDVARISCLSETAFERYFRTRTGRTLVDFLNEMRIGRACRLLAETDRPITEIAFGCGFENLANFNRQFLRRRQVSPRQFRARLEPTTIPS